MELNNQQNLGSKSKLSNEKYPNIIVFISHDTGRYVGYDKGRVNTPNIDRIAKKGIRFTNHFATAPQCSPSRGSILTGKDPHVHGLMGLAHLGWHLPNSNLTMPQFFAIKGYDTYLFGLQHSHKQAKQLGYNHVSPRRDFPYYGSLVKRRFKKFIKKVNEGEVTTPIFCSIGFQETHRPFLPIKKNKATNPDEVQVPPYLPDKAGTRFEISKFEGSVKELDLQIGQILYMIENSRLADNTIMIFTVDHGWPFPRAKCTLYDPGIETSLAIRWDDHLPKNKTYSELLSNVDLFPTLIELAGFSVPKSLQKKMQGRSFRSLITDEGYKPRKYIFAEMSYHEDGFNPIRGIRSNKWKYIYNFSNFRDVKFQIPGEVKSAKSGQEYLNNHPQYHQPRPEEELYNLQTDPWELENLANNAKYQPIKQRLKERLWRHMTITKDPILDGEIQAPKEPRRIKIY